MLSESIAKAEAHCRDAELASETSGDLSQSAAQCKSERERESFHKPIPVMIDDEKVTQLNGEPPSGVKHFEIRRFHEISS